MASADILFSAELEVGTLSPFIDLPSGAWMKKPKQDGSKREKNMWRMIKPSFYVKTEVAPEGWMDKYLEKWSLLD